MKKKLIEDFLKDNPKAYKAKDGIIIKTDEGLLHLTGMLKTSDFEGLGAEAMFFCFFLFPQRYRKN